MGSAAPPRTCSCTRGRLAKNIPERVTKVPAGIEKLIRDHPRVNKFFQFFQKNFQDQLPAFSTPSLRKIRTPAKLEYMSFDGRMTLCINKTTACEGRFYLPRERADYFFPLRFSRNCTTNSKATGNIDTRIMPITTASKCFCTQGICPKKSPADIMSRTQRMLPTIV